MITQPTDQMHQARIPYQVSKVRKSLIPVQAMMVISPQIIWSERPSWFVENPPSWSVPPIMGRVIAQPIGCAIVKDPTEIPTKKNSIISYSIPVIPRPSEDDFEPSTVSEESLSMIAQTHIEDSKHPNTDWDAFWHSFYMADSKSDISRLDGWSSSSEISKLDGWSSQSEDDRDSGYDIM